ncbi:MAG: hypothetical protein COX17_01100 [Deltaproteobacteria bacterium CG23_combo_of_CG06-09_8_20_14_all_60_8]|nr:MAG: hypothetical protein COX17_01100 [Deltaproteobacteria bacterium CG23_combo_of_CG06-09_8_20_14_all_60_8]
MRCFFCNTEIAISERVAFREECPKCRGALHICKSCTFYDEGAYNECRESSGERVTDKERANHCEYFRPGTAGGKTDNTADLARQRLEALFKK